MTDHDKMIDTLRRFYPALPFLERHGQVYPLVIYPAAPEQALDDLLALTPPRQFLPKDNFAIYDEGVLAHIREGGGRLFNGMTFTFAGLQTDPLQISGALGYYFDHLATCVALEQEILAGGPPRLREQLHHAISTEDLIRSGRGRSAALGGGMLIVFRKADGYHALFTQRSMQTATRPGAYQVVPAFVVQPSVPDYPDEQWRLSGHFKREYAEELFGVVERENGGPAESPALTALEDMLADGRANLLPTGVMFNLTTTHVSACALLVIHDVDWYPHLQAHRGTTWETAHQFSFPVEDDTAMLAALPPDFYQRLTPQAAASFWLGVERARQIILKCI